MPNVWFRGTSAALIVGCLSAVPAEARHKGRVCRAPVASAQAIYNPVLYRPIPGVGSCPAPFPVPPPANVVRERIKVKRRYR